MIGLADLGWDMFIVHMVAIKLSWPLPHPLDDLPEMHSDIVLDYAEFAAAMAVFPTGNATTHLAGYVNGRTAGNALKPTAHV
jgi:hypothetical protein